MPEQVNYNFADILKRVENSPALIQAAGSKEALKETLERAFQQDQAFFEKNGQFFDGGSGGKAFEESYMRTYGGSYEKNAPSLLATTLHNAEKLGISPDSKGFDLVIKSAILGELDRPKVNTNGYHDASHFSQVGDVTAYLQQKTDHLVASGDPRVVAQTPDQKAITLATALTHDLGHAGKGNDATTDKFRNEKASFEAFSPLMQETGYNDTDIAISKATFLATSPNGGIQLIDRALEMEKHQGTIDTEALKREFPDAPDELIQAAKNPEILRQHIGPVMDADMAGSAYAGRAANQLNSRKLIDETGIQALGSTKSREWYLENLVKNTVSPAGQETIQQNREALLHTTKENNAASARMIEGMTEAAKTQPHPTGLWSKFKLQAHGLAGLAVGTVTTLGLMAGGTDTAEAAEAGYKGSAPFGETQIETAKAGIAALEGDTQEAKEHINNAKNSATAETGSWGASGGTLSGIAATKAGQTALAEASTLTAEGLGGLAEMAEVLGPGMIARTGGKLLLGLTAATGTGLVASLALEIGQRELEELEKQGHADFLKGGKIDTIEEARTLENAMLHSEHSPLPQTIKIEGKEMSIGMALREHPEKIEEAMKDSPEALALITKWKALNDYEKGLMNNTTTPGTESHVQATQQAPKVTLPQPA